MLRGFRLALGVIGLQALEGMEHSLSQQGKLCPAIAHPLDEFELVHFSLDQTVVLRKGQSCSNRSFVSLNTSHKALEFADLAGSNVCESAVELFSGARP
jgi:hypothetical protein